MMQLTRRLVALATLLALVAPAAWAQAYPAHSIRLMVGYPAGGGMDGVGRILAQKLGERLGQSVLVDNRPGASGMLAADAVAKAAPDGYTLLLGETGLLIAPSISSKVPVDPVKSFTPITNICALPLTFVVTNDFPARDMQEFIAALKAAPGKYTYGSPGIGTVQHFAFEQFKRAVGVDVRHIPYKGGSTMVPDLIAGRIDIGILSSSAAVGNVRAGKMRAIAVTSTQRVSNLPEVPTVAEVVPNFDAAPRIFLMGPAGLPPKITAQLAAAVMAALEAKDLQESFVNQGATVTPAAGGDFRAAIVAEMERWSAIARVIGIKPE